MDDRRKIDQRITERRKYLPQTPQGIVLSGIDTMARARTSDVNTSHKAAKGANKSGKGKAIIKAALAYVTSQGWQGANAWEIAKALDLDYHDVNRQMKKLEGVLLRSGLSRPGFHDPGMVWKLAKYVNGPEAPN
jgi:hypothetical protein